MEFGDRLKELRKKAGYTQAQLAEKANVTKSVISFYEHKQRSPAPDVLKQFAVIFNVSTDYLLGIERNIPDMIDVSGLTEREVRAVQIMVDTLRGNKEKREEKY